MFNPTAAPTGGSPARKPDETKLMEVRRADPKEDGVCPGSGLYRSVTPLRSRLTSKSEKEASLRVSPHR